MKLEIKKYPNRRYYDATHSRHLTLDQIRSLIQQGYDITVTDAKTGDDITAQLLTQIILELETAKLDSFPVPLLVRLIRMNDQVVKDFIENYFNQALKSFLDYQRQFGEQVIRAQSLPSVTAWTEAMFKPFASAFASPKGGPGAEPSPSPTEVKEDKDLREMIHSLQKEVAELKEGRQQAGKKSRHKPRAPQRQSRRTS